MSTDLHVLDPALFIIRKVPFRSIPLLKDRRVPGTALIGVVHIFPHPVVRRKQIHIFPFQNLSGPVNGSQGILIGILRVVEQLYIVFINQVFKFLLQITNDNGDVANPHFMQLTDLPLDHPLPKHFQKSLRRLESKRYKPGTESSGDNHRPVYLKRLHKLHTIRSHLIMIIIHYFYIMKRQTFLHQLIHRPKRKIQLLSHLPLRDLSPFQNAAADQCISVHKCLRSKMINF